MSVLDTKHCSISPCPPRAHCQRRKVVAVVCLDADSIARRHVMHRDRATLCRPIDRRTLWTDVWGTGSATPTPAPCTRHRRTDSEYAECTDKIILQIYIIIHQVITLSVSLSSSSFYLNQATWPIGYTCKHTLTYRQTDRQTDRISKKKYNKTQ